jgi:hypothetical protein
VIDEVLFDFTDGLAKRLVEPHLDDRDDLA